MPRNDKKRSAHLDNCKGILILFVVWYHSLVVYYDPDLTSIPGLTGVETILLLLVMPGFSLLSGFLSSSNLNAKRQDNLFSTGAAFVIFQIINWMMGIFNTIGLDAFLSASSNSSKSSNTSSSSNNTIQYPIPIFFPTVMSHIPDTKALPVTWFLLALLFWRILTPLIIRLKRPIATSFVLGMLGLVTDLGFGSQNIIAFLPWYVIGVAARHTKQGQTIWQEKIVLRSNFIVTFLLIVLPFICCITISIFIPTWWNNTIGYFISHGYSCLYGLPPSATANSCTSLYSWGTRCLFYLFSIPIIVGFLRIVPNEKIAVLTKSGINSIAIYLFHPILLFNIVTLIVVSKSLDIITDGKGAVKLNGAPPYQGSVSFILITLLGVSVFMVLSLDCWRCCCWICLRPPVVNGLIMKRTEQMENVIEDGKNEDGTEGSTSINGGLKTPLL